MLFGLILLASLLTWWSMGLLLKVLDRLWRVVGPLWGRLSFSLALLGVILGSSWQLLAGFGGLLDAQSR